MNDDDLIARALQILAARAAGVGAPPLTVAQLYARWEAAHRTTRSFSTNEVRIRPFVKAFADRDVMSLRVLDWSDHRAAREAEEIPTGKPGRHLKASTLNLELGCIKSFLTWGVTEGRIPHNPLSVAKRVRARRHRETAPAEHDIEAILANAGAQQRVVILCAADAGMRCSEIRALSWDWLDTEAMAIKLPNWACKGGRGGTVPMTMRLYHAIESIPRTLRSPYVLTSPRPDSPDGRYDRRTLSRWWRAAADAAGVLAAPGDERVHLHDGRHAFASNATRRGIRIEMVSKILRHASLDQTRDYVQTSDADLRAALADFEAGILKDQQRRGPRRVTESEAHNDSSDKSKSEKK